jgi:uncharacterized protein
MDATLSRPGRRSKRSNEILRLVRIVLRPSLVSLPIDRAQAVLVRKPSLRPRRRRSSNARPTPETSRREHPGVRGRRCARRAIGRAFAHERGALVSTDFVLDGTLTLLRMRLGLDAAESWWKTVDASSRVTWEWIDATRAEKARNWFFRWRDKDFSFTDCTSFVVMSERRLAKVMTSDRHFVEAGFEIVPVPPRARHRRRRRMR